MKHRSWLLLLVAGCLPNFAAASDSEAAPQEKPRVIVTSDGEIDDECSLVRFLLYANELDIEGIITTSSQYHWHGHKWAGDDWAQPYLAAYAEVYPNLIKHDPALSQAGIPHGANLVRQRQSRRRNVRSHSRVAADRRSAARRVRQSADLDSGLGWHQHHRARAENDRRGAPGEDGCGRAERSASTSSGSRTTLTRAISARTGGSSRYRRSFPTSSLHFSMPGRNTCPPTSRPT